MQGKPVLQYETTQLLESIIIKGALPANPARLGEKCWLMEDFWESQNVIGKIQASIQAEANSSQLYNNVCIH